MSLIGDSIELYKREMLIFWANAKTNLVRAAIFPLVIILLFGNLGSSVSNVPVVVVNYANNAQSNQFITSLSQQNFMSVKTITTQQEALSLLNAGKTSFVIVILPNFPSKSGASAIQVYYTNTQYTVTSAILPAIEAHATAFTSPAGFQLESSRSLGSSSPAITTPISDANGNYKEFLFSGIIGMVIVFSALFGGGISIITDRTGGYIKAFLVTPINKTAILLGRVFSGMVQSILYIIIVLIIGFADGSTIAMGWIGLIWIFVFGLVLAVCFTSLAAIVASRMKNIQAYAMISQAVGMPLWLLSGGIFPVASMPAILQEFSVLDPMTYATDAFRWVVLQGTFPVANIVTDMGVLLAFALITTFVSIELFKDTID